MKTIIEYLMQDINRVVENTPANKSNYEFAFGTEIYTDEKIFWMNIKSIDLYKTELENLSDNQSGGVYNYKNLYQRAESLRDSFDITYICIIYNTKEHNWSINLSNHKNKREVNQSLKYCTDVQYFKDVTWEGWLKYIGEI